MSTAKTTQATACARVSRIASTIRRLHDYEVLDLPRGDDFDGWVQSRNDRYEHAASRQYVSEDVIGYADLDDYGGWNDVPEYGHVWYPTNVQAGWAPYRDGHWSWVDPWGWTWVDQAAWGFAPFHYGRWVYAGDRWGWCPGQIAARPIYAPALVGFVGGAGWGVGISTGPVGWFPLGPRDVFVPWYHTSHNYFTNVNVRNTTIINNTNITNVYNNYSRGTPINNANYAYRTNAAAVTAVSREAFVGSRAVGAARVQVNENQLRNANVVSRVGIAPERASFVAANAAKARVVPTAQTLDRRVIARTPPPPRAAPVTARIDAIKRNNGQPLATQQLRQISPATTAAAGAAAGAGRGQPQRVTLVGQGGPKPQPLPLHGTVNANGVNANGAQTGQTGVRGTPPKTITTSPANNANATVNGRTQTNAKGNATVQQGQKATVNGVPSSQFAPHAGQPRTTTNNEGVVTRNTNTPNTATVHDKTVNGRTANGGQTNGSQTRSTTTNNNAVSNNTGHGNATVHTPPQTHTPQVERKVVNDSSTHNPNGTTNTNNPNGSQSRYTPHTDSRGVQQQQTTHTYTPPQPQTHVAPPQPQVQHAPVVQQEHHAPPPRDTTKKDKDNKDKDDGGHR